MKAIIQRVSEAYVKVNSKQVSSINQGILCLLCVEETDSEKDIDYIVNKISNLRIFPNSSGRFDKSLFDIGAELMLVSQFTLAANIDSGRRPSFSNAARPEKAKEYYERVCSLFRQDKIKVAQGVFGEHMEVSSTNNGPVTIWIDSKKNS